MKVICAGMSKTGTTSMNAALTELGYSVYDYPENYEFYCDKWMAMVKDGWKREDFLEMFDNVDATCDGPAYCFWEEILDAFPDAKVILTTRDSDGEWYQSMKQQLEAVNFMANVRFRSLVSPTYRRYWGYSQSAGMLPFGSKEFRPVLDAVIPVPELPFKQAYRRHNAHVLQNCPEDKLLVYNCKDGWEPMCKFLGKEIPQKPFPRANVASQNAVDVWKTPTFRRISMETYFTTCVFALLGGLAIFTLGKKYLDPSRHL